MEFAGFSTRDALDVGAGRPLQEQVSTHVVSLLSDRVLPMGQLEQYCRQWP